ncbi:hypothetical protein ISP17_04625 [Dyella ginsengisoli]|uniref:Tetratricopeptide repeat protein n=1 Tax=Dyella ginsengisoli TaxID=363848 RepID=A0ABW8JQ36_9GAMM
MTAWVYWAGLHGPFLLDDSNNLAPINAWLHGADSWRHVMFSNGSGMFGRSLSMATLMLSAWLGGYTPFAFKLGNLLVHLLCGLAGWHLLRRALARDARLAAHASLTAALLAAMWLLHPLNVSTTLYAVQRMAQISTLFTLASLGVYLAARQALEQGNGRRALVGLFVLFPLLVALGLLGKENAVVAPALCLVLELAYFGHTRADKRALGAFYTLFLAVPGLLASTWLLHAGGLLSGYRERDFTLPQRLLSESRALMDYVGALLLPRGPSMGVFTDDFATSTGWLSPPTTLFSVLALVTLTALAVALRKRAPSVFAGWFFFLVAHAVESSFLPLELYFEHRNYLPAFGLLLAVAGMAELVTRKLHTQNLSRHQLGLLAATAFALALGFATYARAVVWSSEGTLLAQEVRYHPGSLRANLASAWYGINHDDVALAHAAFARLLQSPDPRTVELAHINRVLGDCMSAGRAHGEDLQQAVALAQPKVTLGEMYAFDNLADFGAQRPCKGAEPATVADTIVAMLAATPSQSDGERAKWRLRLTAAELYAQTGDWVRAMPQARLAWQPGADAPVGAFLIRVYVHNGMHAEAERMYAEVARRAKPGDINDQRGLAALREFLDQDATKAKPESPAPTP